MHVEIPEDATNVDWELRQRAVHVDETSQHLSPYEIDEPSRQIDEKGDAITSVTHQVEGWRQDAPWGHSEGEIRRSPCASTVRFRAESRSLRTSTTAGAAVLYSYKNHLVHSKRPAASVRWAATKPTSRPCRAAHLKCPR
jgi:hypothetical protein